MSEEHDVPEVEEQPKLPRPTVPTFDSDDSTSERLFTTAEAHGRPSRPTRQRGFTRALSATQTMGVRLQATVMKNRIVVILGVIAVIATPVWLFSGQIHGDKMDLKDAIIEELRREVEDLEEEVDELEEEKEELIRQLLAE